MEIYMSKQRAFTLIELIVTLAVLAIVAAIALPAFGDFLRGVRASSDVSAITGSLSLARSEAIKRNRNVCIQSDDWAAGWVVRIDDNGDGSCGEGETLLREFSGISTEASLDVQKDGGGSSGVLFRGNGRADGLYSLDYRSKENECTEHRDRVLNIATTGRTQIGRCS